MTNLITAISNWLINSHSLAMPGWMWLVAVPAAIVVLGVAFYTLGWLVFLNTFRPW